jgi:hypothetical protein
MVAFTQGGSLTEDATLVSDDSAATPVANRLDGELKVLRDKAGRIAEELAALYRQADDLQQQIEAHQRR